MECVESNYYRLVAFVADVAPEVVREYFRRNVLRGDNFDTYLKKHKHTIFHLFCITTCCECSQESQRREKCLSHDQYSLMFEPNLRTKHYIKNKRCICMYSPKQNISLQHLDVTLACCILKNCESLDQSEEHWLSTIKEVRNKIVHTTGTKSISNTDFNNYWQILEGAVLGLASLVDQQLKDKVAAMVVFLQRKTMLNSDVLKVTQLLHEWWKEKCVEMENTQREVLSKTGEIASGIGQLHCKMNKLLDQVQSSLYVENDDSLDEKKKPRETETGFETDKLDKEMMDEESFREKTDEYNEDNIKDKGTENSKENQEVVVTECNLGKQAFGFKTDKLHTEMMGEESFREKTDEYMEDNIKDKGTEKSKENQEVVHLCLETDKLDTELMDEESLREKTDEYNEDNIKDKGIEKSKENQEVVVTECNLGKQAFETKSFVAEVGVNVPADWNATKVEEVFREMQTFMGKVGSNMTITSISAGFKRLNL